MDITQLKLSVLAKKKELWDVTLTVKIKKEKEIFNYGT